MCHYLPRIPFFIFNFLLGNNVLTANMRGTNDIPQMNEAQFNHFDVAFAVSKALEGQSLAKHGSRAPIITPRVSDNFAAQAAHQNQIEHHNVRNIFL
jgi:hypothetical protein